MKRSGRGLGREEARLWLEVARTVAPLPGRVLPPAPPEAPSAAPASVNVRLDSPARPHPPRPAPAVPVTIDRRTARALARERIEIEAVLDLHGLTQAQAHSRLLGFLRQAQRSGLRYVRVITGHGLAGSSADRGVLRRSVPLWLELPEFRSLVVGVGVADRRQGGAGALNLRLRRPAGT